MRRVGVTGGQGFIGKWVTDELLRLGFEVLILDHKQRPAKDFINNPSVDYLWGDIRDETTVMELTAHVDGVIHLAAVLGTQETIEDPRPAALTNLEGGLNFLHALKRYDLPGVYIAVGNSWMNNPYSISKTTVERFCHMYRDEHGTSINQVRAVNAYGPGQAAAPPYGSGVVRKITPAFICRALSGHPIEIYGDGEQISDMVWVGDVARTLVEALVQANDRPTHEFVIECGPVQSNTVNDVANMIRLHSEALGYRRVELVHLPMRPGEIAGAVVSADTTTLSRIGMNPESFVPLSFGLRKTVEWFHENKGVTWA